MTTLDQFFNPLDPAVLEDPFPTYKRLREAHPVYWHEQLNSWVITRYEDCAFVLGNSDLFAADFRRVGVPTPPPILNLQTLDPPEQSPLRSFAMNAVRAQDLEALETNAIARARDFADRLASQETFDFVKDFADPFTLSTISELLGVRPPEQDEAWHRLNQDLDKSMDAELAPDSEEAGLKARAAFSALVETWLTNHQEGGIVAYVAENLDQAGVSQEILVNSLRAFWHAGFEVPSRFLGNALLALLRHPEAAAQFRHASSLDCAVEELVRYAGPVHALSRACTGDLQLGGRDIKRGDIVVTLIAAANRDPEQFDRPETINLRRRPNRHLGFGRGPHSCLGTAVARIEARAVLTSVLRDYPESCLAGMPKPTPNATLRGLGSLPIRLGTPRVTVGPLGQPNAAVRDSSASLGTGPGASARRAGLPGAFGEQPPHVGQEGQV